MACRISDFLKVEWIAQELRSVSKDEVLRELAVHLEKNGAGVGAEDLYLRLCEREQKASTGAEHGLAIPHATIPILPRLIVGLGRSRAGIEFGALDNQRSHFFFVIVTHGRALTSGETSYLQVISSICKLMRSATLRNRLFEAHGAQEMLDLLIDEEANRMSKGAAAV